jgi:hypothetical protein
MSISLKVIGQSMVAYIREIGLFRTYCAKLYHKEQVPLLNAHTRLIPQKRVSRDSFSSMGSAEEPKSVWHRQYQVADEP